jgi:enediyne biosynthesis protein E4
VNRPSDDFEEKRGGGAAGEDAAIGKALRWSIAALLLIVSATVFLLVKGTPSRNGDSLPNSDGTFPDRAPRVVFTNVTASAGITFRHRNGAQGEKFLPETMGGGCAFLDFDNDGDQDILFVNSGDWPWGDKAATRPSALALFRNDGKGNFTEASTDTGLLLDAYGMGCAVGDFDNDGFPDIFVTGVGGSHLFRNEGGTRFRDVTTEAGVGGSAEDWTTSASWLDIDNDGDLDLFVCSYVRWSREIDIAVDYKLPGIGRAYGPPMSFTGTYPYLYRNEGHGRFTDISAAAGIQIKNKATGQPLAKSLGLAPIDLDGDGWIDVIVANDTVQNFVFHNERNGTFKEIGEVTGTAFDKYGKVRGAMGIDAARFQDDDSLAVSIGNFANEMTALYVAKPNSLTFADEAIAQGIGAASRHLLTFGVFFFDYDLDGWLDLLTTNGHLDEQISRVQPDQPYRQSAQLFWNARGVRTSGGFVAVPTEESNRALFQPIVGRGSAFADIDGDGDLDVLLTQAGDVPMLLRNDQQLNHHWMRLKLTGSRANRDGIGAWVKVRAGGRTLLRHVMPARGYLSQSELPVTFGLGAVDRVEEVSITWPGGEVQKVDGLRVDAVNSVIQPRK